VDAVLMRITDIFLSFPGILIAICFAALTGPDIKNVIFALGLMGWVSFARLARVQTLKIKNEDYVQSAIISGTSTFTILMVCVLPNIAAPLIIESVFTIAGAMLSEAGLSFLGIGIQAPDPSLGSMLREGARYLLVAPHLVVVPGATLMCIVFTLNLAGDKLRDTLDKREEDI
jgi:peptide/nickel transport system permease protein